MPVFFARGVSARATTRRRTLLAVSSILLAALAAPPSCVAAEAPHAAAAEEAKEPTGAPLMVVSDYRFQPGVGEADVLRTLEGFMNLTKSIKAAHQLTAGPDLRLDVEPGSAANFSMTARALEWDGCLGLNGVGAKCV